MASFVLNRTSNNKQKTNKKQTNNKFATVQFALQQQKTSFVCPGELLPPPTHGRMGIGM